MDDVRRSEILRDTVDDTRNLALGQCGSRSRAKRDPGTTTTSLEDSRLTFITQSHDELIGLQRAALTTPRKLFEKNLTGIDRAIDQ